MAPPSRRLVVDTDIIRSAGGPERSAQRSKTCSKTLEIVYNVCHSIVLSPELHKEYNRHHSRWASAWLTKMFGAKKIVRFTIENHPLRQRLLEIPNQAIQRDVPLVLCALSTDSIILSCDEEARRNFAGTSMQIPEIGSIHWANPEKIEEDVCGWLKAGAPNQCGRQLSQP